MHAIVVFPPAAGGNHLRNLIDPTLDKTYLLDLYKEKSPWVHANVGANFQIDRFLTQKLSHGHFGEIMSHQGIIREMANDIKLIVLSPDTPQDREILFNRRQKLNFTACPLPGDYFDSEQVFLYESFMYHYYFDIPRSNIMNVSVSQFFSDICKYLK